MTDLLTDVTDSDVTINPNKNYVEELVGEGKKFKTVEDMARGKYLADIALKTKEKAFDDLSRDFLTLREDYNARASLKEIIDQMPKQLTSNELPPVNEVTMPIYDPKEVENIAVAKFREMEVTRLQETNAQQVRSKLIAQFGTEYQTAVKSQLDDLGISPELFNSLAKNNPKLLERTLGLDLPKNTTDNFQAPPRNSQNSFLPEGGQKRTWKYYQELKQSNPKLYTNPKTQMQMNKDYESLGIEFEDGNFHQYNH